MGQIEVVRFMEANILALIVLLIVYLNTRKYSYKYAYEQKLYTYLIFLNASMIMLDIIRVYSNGKSGSLMYGSNMTASTLMYAFSPVVSMVWAIYIDYKIFMDRKKIKKEFKYMIILSLINIVVAIITVFGGIKGKAIFHIDANNIYRRGELQKFTIITTYIYLIYAMVSIFKNKDIIDEVEYKSLRLFAIPPFIGGFLQAAIYGLKLTWISLAVSMLIIFVYVQNNLLYVDVLTGLYNRRNLEKYLKNIFSRSDKRKTKVIGGVLLDINDFKFINDTYGHDEGDRALEAVAKMLKDGFSREDFIFRYAGDEFVAVCEVKDFNELRERIIKFEMIVNMYNATSNKPYKISISKGYAVFENNSVMTDDYFITKIDNLMYQDKEKYRDKKKSRVEINSAEI